MWEVLGNVLAVFLGSSGASSSGEIGRDYSLKYPKRRRAGWFSKLIVLLLLGYLIYAALKRAELL